MPTQCGEEGCTNDATYKVGVKNKWCFQVCGGHIEKARGQAMDLKSDGDVIVVEPINACEDLGPRKWGALNLVDANPVGGENRHNAYPQP